MKNKDNDKEDENILTEEIPFYIPNLFTQHAPDESAGRVLFLSNSIFSHSPPRAASTARFSIAARALSYS